MATVFRRAGTSFWQTAFLVKEVDTGEVRRIYRSTGQTTRREAERVASEMERAARDAAGCSEEKSRKVLSILSRAGEDALRGVLNVVKAREYLREILVASTGESFATHSVAAWLAEWEARKRVVVSVATRKRYAASARAFLAWLGDKRAEKPLESITSSDVRKFRDSIRQSGVTGRTANHYAKDLRCAFGAALKEGLIPANPCAPLESLPQDDGVSRQPFSKTEVQRLVAHAPSSDWRGLVLVGVYCGLRLGDAARLKWGDVDLLEGVLKIIPSKTKRKGISVVIPLHRDLRAVLEALPSSDDPSAAIFPSLAKSTVSGRAGLSATFGMLMDNAKVSRGETKEAKGRGRLIHARGFHSLRHTFTTWLANAGVSDEIRMAMTGHTETATHQLYSHHDLESFRRAVDMVDSVKP